MDAIFRYIAITSACMLPVIVVVIVIARKRRAWRAANEIPFRELRRRPAGEFLRLKIEKLNEAVDDWSGWLLAIPLLLPAAMSRSGGYAPGAIILAFLVSSGWAVVCGRKLYRLGRERANYQLGFNGERFVGEELNGLMREGFEVYHDVPFDGFNMDHVLVGQPGVFLVETKTRRKPVNESGEKSYRVEYDGTRLHWTWGTDQADLNQTAANSRTLSQWLSNAVGEPVRVTAILTLPGWLIERKAPAVGVQVLNPKEIPSFCAGRPKEMDAVFIRRVCHQLNQKCKLGIN